MKKSRLRLTTKQRQSIIEESFYKCSIYNCSNTAYHVHHIDGNCQKPRDNRPDNLLALCPHCHEKATRGIISISECIDIKKKLIALAPAGIENNDELVVFTKRLADYLDNGELLYLEMASHYLLKSIYASKSKYPHLIAKAESCIAEVNLQKGTVYKAIGPIRRSIYYYERVGDYNNLARCLVLHGIINNIAKFNEEAIISIDKAIVNMDKIENDISKRKLQGWAYCVKGIYSHFLGETKEAYDCIEHSIHINETIDGYLKMRERLEPHIRMAGLLIADNKMVEADRILQQSETIVGNTKWLTDIIIYNKIKYDFLINTHQLHEAQNVLLHAWEYCLENRNYNQQKQLLERLLVNPNICHEIIRESIIKKHERTHSTQIYTLEDLMRLYIEELEIFMKGGV